MAPLLDRLLAQGLIDHDHPSSCRLVLEESNNAWRQVGGRRLLSRLDGCSSVGLAELTFRGVGLAVSVFESAFISVTTSVLTLLTADFNHFPAPDADKRRFAYRIGWLNRSASLRACSYGFQCAIDRFLHERSAFLLR